MPRTPVERAPRKKRRQSPSVVPTLLVGGAVVYAVAIGLFALTHYDDGRPRAGQVVKDFHAYLGLGPGTARAAPAPKPVAVVKPRPVPAPLPPIVRPEPSPLDQVASVLKEVAREAPALKHLDRGATFDDVRFTLLSQLADARDTLGAILDREPGNDRANGLWDRLQYLQAALRKL